MKKIRKITLFSLTLLLTVYLMLFLFPQIAFGNKIEYKSFIIYSHSPLNKNIFKILDSAQSLISYSELYKNNAEQHRIYLCNNFLEYSFFAPAERNAFGYNRILENDIFISKSNILHNRVERNGNENNIRTLSGTIAHEVTHTLIKKQIGFIKYMQLDTWKNEGYCDFIAKESSFDSAKGIFTLCNYPTSSSLSFQYFKYRLYIDYLIKEKNSSFNEIVQGNFNLTQLQIDVKKKYCTKP